MLSSPYLGLIISSIGCGGCEVGSHQHRASIILLISSGVAKITAARSPNMPAGMIAGAPLTGPSLPESVMKRRLRSQKARVLPSAEVTRDGSRAAEGAVSSVAGSGLCIIGESAP